MHIACLTFVAFGFDLVQVIFAHIFQGYGYFTGIGAIISWLPECQWNNLDDFGQKVTWIRVQFIHNITAALKNTTQAYAVISMG